MSAVVLSTSTSKQVLALAALLKFTMATGVYYLYLLTVDGKFQLKGKTNFS